MKVFGDERSGNCLKVKWLLDYQGQRYEWHHVDIMQGQSRTPEFLAVNPAGQVPVVLFDGGWALAQSNAILLHLGEGTVLVPDQSRIRARMLEWMFWEQYNHEPTIAVRRFRKVYQGKQDAEIEPALMDKGRAALARMELQLRDTDWLCGAEANLADLCLLPYTLLAPQGGFEMGDFPAVGRWLERSVDAFRVELTAHILETN